MALLAGMLILNPKVVSRLKNGEKTCRCYLVILRRAFSRQGSKREEISLTSEILDHVLLALFLIPPNFPPQPRSHCQCRDSKKESKT